MYIYIHTEWTISKATKVDRTFELRTLHEKKKLGLMCIRSVLTLQVISNDLDLSFASHGICSHCRLPKITMCQAKVLWKRKKRLLWRCSSYFSSQLYAVFSSIDHRQFKALCRWSCFLLEECHLVSLAESTTSFKTTTVATQRLFVAKNGKDTTKYNRSIQE